MKRTLLFLLILPFAALAQKVKINEYDKFIKQRRIEMEPVIVLSSPTANISLTYNCIGSTFYVLLSGFGWGVSSISAENDLIFLLANDQTVSVRSTGVQMYEISMPNNTYKHKYFISLADIEALSKSEIVGIRKYTVQDFVDMKVAGQYAGNIKKLSSLFIHELKAGRVLLQLQDIAVEDVAKHVGDSVRFCSKVFSTRYFDSSLNLPVFLNVGANYPNQLLTAIIPEEERIQFNNMPETLYDGKEVCICGVVQLNKDHPQIVVRKRAQMTVKTPVHLNEVAMYIGDSVTVYGKVAASKYFPDVEGAPTLLYMGPELANPQLTVIVEGMEGKTAEEKKANYYANKEVEVKGKLVANKGKAQLLVNKNEQIAIVRNAAAAATAGVEKKEKPMVQNASMVLSKKAEFPTGIQGWKEFLNKNIMVPDELEIGEQKKVIARVAVEEDGTLDFLHIVQSAGRIYDNEVMRVLKNAPKWNPELQNGMPVPSTLLVSVAFERIDPN